MGGGRGTHPSGPGTLWDLQSIIGSSPRCTSVCLSASTKSVRLRTVTCIVTLKIRALSALFSQFSMRISNAPGSHSEANELAKHCMRSLIGYLIDKYMRENPANARRSEIIAEAIQRYKLRVLNHILKAIESGRDGRIFFLGLRFPSCAAPSVCVSLVAPAPRSSS